MRQKDKEALTEDYNSEKLRKVIWSESLQHPTTLAPAALAILSGAYMGLLNPSPATFGLALAGAFGAMASVVFHYFIRGEKVAEAYVKDIQEERKKARNAVSEDLARRCQDAGFRDGVQQVVELNAAYGKLTDFLEASQNQNVAGTDRYRIMARDCYREALRLLDLALSSFKVLGQIDVAKLQQEKGEWERQAKVLAVAIAQGNQGHAERLEALNARIDANAQRLARHQERRVTLDKLLGEYEQLEAALENAHLELVDLVGRNTSAVGTQAGIGLERAVNAARKVENRLRGVENGPSEDDDAVYLQAATKHRVEPDHP